MWGSIVMVEKFCGIVGYETEGEVQSAFIAIAMNFSNFLLYNSLETIELMIK